MSAHSALRQRVGNNYEVHEPTPRTRTHKNPLYPLLRWLVATEDCSDGSVRVHSQETHTDNSCYTKTKTLKKKDKEQNTKITRVFVRRLAKNKSSLSKTNTLKTKAHHLYSHEGGGHNKKQVDAPAGAPAVIRLSVRVGGCVPCIPNP